MSDRFSDEEKIGRIFLINFLNEVFVKSQQWNSIINLAADVLLFVLKVENKIVSLFRCCFCEVFLRVAQWAKNQKNVQKLKFSSEFNKLNFI